jgi:mycothiol system anti-sigma-R factor
MECREAIDRLSPFLDDELDPVTSREVSAHLESCPECAAAFDRQRKLRESLQRGLEYHRAPDLLRARVMREVRAAAGQPGARERVPARSWRWLSAVAAVLSVAIVTVAGGNWLLVTLPRERADERMASEVVSGHVRALMADHLTDVASTDQHTVKPWFAGKLDFSPPVNDFAAAGYPLVGGRLDVLQGHPVAALVYLRHKHVINVFVWPVTDAGERFTPATTRQGFHVLHGTHSAMAYWVVSDLNPEELADFARMLAAPPAMPSQDSLPPLR